MSEIPDKVKPDPVVVSLDFRTVEKAMKINGPFEQAQNAIMDLIVDIERQVYGGHGAEREAGHE